MRITGPTPEGGITAARIVCTDHDKVVDLVKLWPNGGATIRPKTRPSDAILIDAPILLENVHVPICKTWCSEGKHHVDYDMVEVREALTQFKSTGRASKVRASTPKP
jgi:hypothetical protein